MDQCPESIGGDGGLSLQLSAEIIGDEELSRALKRAPQITVKELSGALNRSAARVEFLAKQNAPIQYGNLRGSINTKEAEAIGDDIQASVGTNVEYARYQEEGTGIYGPSKRPIRPKNAKILFWKSGGISYFAKEVKGVRPKRYFRTAKQEATPYFMDRLREAMGRIVTILATK